MRQSAAAKQIIAVDLGDGTTCVGTAELNPGEPEGVQALPVIRDLGLGGVKMIPTAYALSPDNQGETIGHEAICAAGEGADLCISMKHTPSRMDRRQKKAVGRFASLLLTRMISVNAHSVYPEEAELVIGCPSGWDNSEVTAYENFLTAYIGRPLHVMRESKAALAFMRRDPNSRITREHIEQGVLLLDFGSSTLDWTYLQGDGGRSIHDGSALGARRIEEFLFEHACQCNGVSSDDEVIQANRSRLIFECRLVKEEFFKHPLSPAPPKYARVTLPGGANKGKVRFELELTQEILDEILNRGFCLVDGGPEFGWQKHLENTLREIQGQVSRQMGLKISTVLLTGGACRMPFIQASLSRVLGEKVHSNMSPEPDCCVVRGLALAGRNQLLRPDPPDLTELEPPWCRKRCAEAVTLPANAAVMACIPGLMKTIAEKTVNMVQRDFLFDKLKQWRDGGLKCLKELQEAVCGEATQEFLREKLMLEIQLAIQEWLQSLINGPLQPTAENVRSVNDCLDDELKKLGYERASGTSPNLPLYFSPSTNGTTINASKMIDPLVGNVIWEISEILPYYDEKMKLPKILAIIFALTVYGMPIALVIWIAGSIRYMSEARRRVSAMRSRKECSPPPANAEVLEKAYGKGTRVDIVAQFTSGKALKDAAERTERELWSDRTLLSRIKEETVALVRFHIESEIQRAQPKEQ